MGSATPSQAGADARDGPAVESSECECAARVGGEEQVGANGEGGSLMGGAGERGRE